MDTAIHEPLNVRGEELGVLAGLLAAERNKLLVEIRHTDHRSFREELRHRLELVEELSQRLPASSAAAF